MIFQYHPDTDMLYLKLVTGVSTARQNGNQRIRHKGNQNGFRRSNKKPAKKTRCCSLVVTESEEVAHGVVLDFGERNQVIGIEIEDASTFIHLSGLEVPVLSVADLILSKKVA